MEWGGEHVGTLVTQHDREVELKRHYAMCLTCNVGLFPLDKELHCCRAS